MRRLFWAAAGAAVGIIVVRRVTRTAAKLTPKGLSESLSSAVTDLADAVRAFADDVRAGMAEREAELWSSLEAGTEPATPDTPFDTRGGIR